jgi:uncharacterized protein YndB with AHSA1/START domain
MDGELHQADDRWELRFTRKLPHPPEKVWRALTEAEHLKEWFPDTIEGEMAPGAKLRFVFEDNAMPPFDGEVLVFEPTSRLELRWGTDFLRFSVQPDGDGSVLTMVDSIDELGKAARDGAGWHVCLENLELTLAGKKAPAEMMDRWKQVHGEFVERFGPEAATIGPPAEMMRDS